MKTYKFLGLLFSVLACKITSTGTITVNEKQLMELARKYVSEAISEKIAEFVVQTTADINKNIFNINDRLTYDESVLGNIKIIRDGVKDVYDKTQHREKSNGNSDIIKSKDLKQKKVVNDTYNNNLDRFKEKRKVKNDDMRNANISDRKKEMYIDDGGPDNLRKGKNKNTLITEAQRDDLFGQYNHNNIRHEPREPNKNKKIFHNAQYGDNISGKKRINEKSKVLNREEYTSEFRYTILGGNEYKNTPPLKDLSRVSNRYDNKYIHNTNTMFINDFNDNVNRKDHKPDHNYNNNNVETTDYLTISHDNRNKNLYLNNVDDVHGTQNTFTTKAASSKQTNGDNRSKHIYDDNNNDHYTQNKFTTNPGRYKQNIDENRDRNINDNNLGNVHYTHNKYTPNEDRFELNNGESQNKNMYLNNVDNSYYTQNKHTPNEGRFEQNNRENQKKEMNIDYVDNVHYPSNKYTPDYDYSKHNNENRNNNMYRDNGQYTRQTKYTPNGVRFEKYNDESRYENINYSKHNNENRNNNMYRDNGQYTTHTKYTPNGVRFEKYIDESRYENMNYSKHNNENRNNNMYRDNGQYTTQTKYTPNGVRFEKYNDESRYENMNFDDAHYTQSEYTPNADRSKQNDEKKSYKVNDYSNEMYKMPQRRHLRKEDVQSGNNPKEHQVKYTDETYTSENKESYESNEEEILVIERSTPSKLIKYPPIATTIKTVDTFAESSKEALSIELPPREREKGKKKRAKGKKQKRKRRKGSKKSKKRGEKVKKHTSLSVKETSNEYSQKIEPEHKVNQSDLLMKSLLLSDVIESSIEIPKTYKGRMALNRLQIRRGSQPLI